ncbi:hypothetical protein VNO78_32416 [Psophocarpus tetragonolobus]|uniref:Wall-associated receptor kinase galacturonan-binding domain-containing protein n=1 Tax=Psophocarpus tetragonolobus TaxID=3891 RepID=A0AAN9RS35_PSOTE
MDDDYDMYMLSTCVCWLLLLTTLPQSHSQADDPYCKQLPYNCGLVYDIPYPFWGQSQPAQCHGLDQFELICNYDDNTTSIRFGSHNFTVEHIEVTTHTMRLVRTDLAPDLCSRQIEDIRIPTPFWYPSSVYNISVFYDCSFLSHSIPKERLIFDCENNRGLFYEGVVDQLPGLLHACQEHAQVPLDKSLGYKNDDPLKYLEDALKEGFSLSYNFPNTDKKSMSSSILFLSLFPFICCISMPSPLFPSASIRI